VRVFFITILAAFAFHIPSEAQGPAAWTASLADIQRTAELIPGARPLRLNVVKFAESRRTKNFSVQGAPVEPSVQARTAFQVVYADGTVMVDTGMPVAVHRFFGRGVEEPYDDTAARQVEEAVARARLVVVTHEHGDHIAGVVTGARARQAAPKTLLTRDQVRVLLTSPQMPEIRLMPGDVSRFRVVDYDMYMPVAPGMVLIKAAGHTPGSQMVYVVVESGQEYLLVGDATWHMDGVRQVKGKDAPWVTEDKEAVLAQLAWLNGLTQTEPRLLIVASHDEEQRLDLTRRKLLGDRFE
jgi:glyoxylase-like metal-dependent hydrolase (beta-lactamase superfamily II)